MILRKFTENDIEALFNIYKDEEVNFYLPWFPLKSLKEAEIFFHDKYDKAYKQDKGYRYAICLKTDNVPIGYVNVSMDDNHDLGYGLRKEFWHKGIVTEADKGYRYAICLKTDNVPIGYVNVSMDDNHDLGYGLRKEFWHKGIVTEASKAVLEQVKKDGFLYVTATHDLKNPRSGGVMKQLGMSYKYSYEEQ